MCVSSIDLEQLSVAVFVDVLLRAVPTQACPAEVFPASLRRESFAGPAA